MLFLDPLPEPTQISLQRPQLDPWAAGALRQSACNDARNLVLSLTTTPGRKVQGVAGKSSGLSVSNQSANVASSAVHRLACALLAAGSFSTPGPPAGPPPGTGPTHSPDPAPKGGLSLPFRL